MGLPEKDPTKAVSRSVSMPEDEWDRVDEYAAAHHGDRSTFIRKLAKDHFTGDAPPGRLAIATPDVLRLRMVADSEECPDFIREAIRAAVGILTDEDRHIVTAVLEARPHYGKADSRASPKSGPLGSSEETA